MISSGELTVTGSIPVRGSMNFFTGDVLMSASGRILTPVPNLARSNAGRDFPALKKLSLWLADEAERELIADRAARGFRAPMCWSTRLCDWDSSIEGAIARMRQATSAGGKKPTHPYYGGRLRELLLWAIWDDCDGPSHRHVVWRAHWPAQPMESGEWK